MTEDEPDALGWQRRDRTVYEGPEWAESLAAAGIDVRTWDHNPHFVFAVHNISEQPLKNSHVYMDEAHRLLQVSLPNELVGWGLLPH